MNYPEIIVTHRNTDFDGFAASLAAAKLYPEARICFAGSLNRNVREFYNLHADEIDTVDASMVDFKALERLIIVDTAHCNRLGEFEGVCSRKDVEIVVFDHHRLGVRSERPDFVTPENYVLSEDGSLVTSMLKIIHDRGIEVSPLEATVFALGIHEDTGSLTYPTTTPRDAEALAICMQLGASQSLIGKYLHNPLSEDQRELLLKLVDELEPAAIGDADIFIAAARHPHYVDGLSVVAHKIMNVTDCQALLVMVEMEDRIFIVGRSKSRLLDVAQALAPVGGGGHSQASSAIVKGMSLEETKEKILYNLPSIMEEPVRARDIMSHPVYFIDSTTSIGDALVYCQRYGHSGICVREDDLLVGIVSRKDLDKAVAHKLKHAPVKGIMSRGVMTVEEQTTVHELRQLMATSAVGRLPVVAAGKAGTGKVPVDQVVGIVTRSDVLRTLHPAAVGEAYAQGVVQELDMRQRLDSIRNMSSLFAAVQKLSTSYRGVYLVGGFVRDMIIGEANYDVDIAVEGDGIEFAERLADELGGRVRAHRKFNTAVVVLDRLKPGLRVDVATARTEFYDYPAALPTVEHSSIRRDLYRRDFTINAMAVSLSAHDFGRLLDFFGGLEDIENGVIRVLHNLSFIEDPTRIFRAIRYENRLGFRMNSYTLGLARGCVDMKLVGDLSSARLRDELIWLFSEPEVGHSIRRIGELGLAPSIHPLLTADEQTAELVSRADSAARDYNLMEEIKLWRLRLACMARNLDAGQLGFWTEQLKLKRGDADVISESIVVAHKLVARLEKPGLTRVQIYELLERLPAEAHLLAYAMAKGDEAREAIRLYLAELRFVKIEISGRDLLEMGFTESPQLGEVLHKLKLLKLEGKLDGREEELKRAEQLAGQLQSGTPNNGGRSGGRQTGGV